MTTIIILIVLYAIFRIVVYAISCHLSNKNGGQGPSSYPAYYVSCFGTIRQVTAWGKEGAKLGCELRVPYPVDVQQNGRTIKEIVTIGVVFDNAVDAKEAALVLQKNGYRLREYVDHISDVDLEKLGWLHLKEEKK